jgi:hypothetical protein
MRRVNVQVERKKKVKRTSWRDGLPEWRRIGGSGLGDRIIITGLKYNNDKA